MLPVGHLVCFSFLPIKTKKNQTFSYVVELLLIKEIYGINNEHYCVFFPLLAHSNQMTFLDSQKTLFIHHKSRLKIVWEMKAQEGFLGMFAQST